MMMMMNKLIVLLTLPLSTIACAPTSTSYLAEIVDVSQDGLTLYTTQGTFILSKPQPFIKNKVCVFEAVGGQYIIQETLKCAI
jgi:hypothetical protein